MSNHIIDLREGESYTDTLYYKELDKQEKIIYSILECFEDNDELSDDIIDDILVYLMSINITSVTSEDIDNEWESLYAKRPNDHDELDRRRSKISNTLTGVLEILKLQKIHFENKYRTDVNNGSCRIFLVEALFGSILYGSVFAFYNSERKIGLPEHEGLMIEGITKFPIPTITQILFPELTKDIPKLNSLLIPRVEEIVESLGIRTVYVIPLLRQQRILLKYYGFLRVPKGFEIDLPCDGMTQTIYGAVYKDVN